MKTHLHPGALAALLLLIASGCLRAEVGVAAVDAGKLRASITRALGFLAKEGDQWIEEKNCNGCHHLPELLWSHREAKNRGFPIDEKKFNEWLDWANPKLKDTKAGLEGVAFMVLAKPEKPLPEAEKLMLDAQLPDGSWKPAGQFATMRKWPTSEAQANSTRLFLLALAASDHGQAAAVQARAKAAEYLTKSNETTSVETWISRAVYAQHFGKPAEVETCRAEILKLQHADGGWAWWNAEKQSDALATGQVLHLLTAFADPPTQSAVARAQNWLLSTQREDGGWFLSSTQVSKIDRSDPKKASSLKNANAIYTYWGSSWAALGLLQAMPTAKPQAAKAADKP